jgi:2,4'-dihydroxyacetophenone dioxygenase
MTDKRPDTESLTPYPHPRPEHAPHEIVINDALAEDPRIWVPLGDRVWTRPLCFNTVEGYWTHLLRITKTGVFNRHRHASPVHGYVLKGRWYYLERDWVAEEGSYLFEPPGDTHTLIVPDDVTEMITFFHTTGTLCYVDLDGNITGFEDVFTRLELCRQHYIDIGLGEDYINQFVR